MPAVAGELPVFGAKNLEEWAEDLSFRHDPRVRERAARALGSMGPVAGPAVGDLVAALGDDVSIVRREAATALGRIGAPAAGAVPALAKVLSDDFEDVSLAALRALERLGPAAEPAVPEIRRLLGHRRLAAPAIRTLGSIGPGAVRAAPALSVLARGKDGELAALARDALSSIQDR